MRKAILFLILALSGRTILHADPITERVLTSGIRVVLKPESGTKRVAISLFIRTPKTQSVQEAVVSQMVAHALFYSGTEWVGGYTALVVAQVGGTLETVVTPDYVSLSLVTYRSQLGDAVNLLCEAVRHADFSTYALHEAFLDIERSKDQRTQMPFQAAEQKVFNALSTTPSPSRSSLLSVDHSMAEAYYISHYTPDRIVVSVVGGFNPDTVVSDFDAYLYDFNRASAGPITAKSQSAPTVSHSTNAVLTIPGKICYALVGIQSPEVESPNYPAFLVLQSLLGVGHASRMFIQLRDKQPLGYQVGITWSPEMDTPAIAALQWSTASLPGDRLTSLDSTVASVLTQPPTSEELDRAIAVECTTEMALQQRVREEAYLLGWYEVMGVGWGFQKTLIADMKAVTKSDLMRVASQYLPHRYDLLAIPKEVKPNK